MTDLRGEPVSVTVARKRPAVGRWRWFLRFFILFVLALNVFYAPRARRALSALELQSVQPMVFVANEADTKSPVLTPVITVPKEAIANRDGKTVVFEVRDGRVWVKTVLIGPERQGHVEISAGLAGGETLVAHPPEGMQSGDPVRVKK